MKKKKTKKKSFKPTVKPAKPVGNLQELKILETKYSADTNLVQWKVEFKNGDQRILAIPGTELGLFLGINVIFTPELIIQACKEIKGKTKKFLFIPDSKYVTNEKLDEKKIEELNNEIDQYPLKSIFQEIQKEEEIVEQ